MTQWEELLTEIVDHVKTTCEFIRKTKADIARHDEANERIQRLEERLSRVGNP